MFIKNISPSKIKIYEECPLKFKRKYIEKLPEVFNPNTSENAMQYGSYIHRIFELGWEKESVDELMEIAKEERPKYQFTGYSENQTRKSIKNFFTFNKGLGETAGVEYSFAVEWNGVELNGIIDRLIIGENGGILIIDYKTSKRPATVGSLMKDPQMLMYAFAVHHLFDKPYEKIVLAHYYPHLDKMVHVKFTESMVNTYIKGKLKNQIWDIRKRKKDEFPPHVNKFCDWCGYKDICSAYAGELQIKTLLEQKQNEIDEGRQRSKEYYENRKEEDVNRITV